MKKYYGDYWYRCFFNSKHISFSINNIRNTKSKKEDLVEKYGNEWYKLHISDFEYIGRTYYNYSYLFKQEKDKKHKIHKLAKEDIDDEINVSKRFKSFIFFKIFSTLTATTLPKNIHT